MGVSSIQFSASKLNECKRTETPPSRNFADPQPSRQSIVVTKILQYKPTKQILETKMQHSYIISNSPTKTGGKINVTMHYHQDYYIKN